MRSGHAQAMTRYGGARSWDCTWMRGAERAWRPGSAAPRPSDRLLPPGQLALARGGVQLWLTPGVGPPQAGQLIERGIGAAAEAGEARGPDCGRFGQSRPQK